MSLAKTLSLEGGRIISGKINSHAKEIEAVISQVKGVLSSQVVCEDNTIVEIHVLADHSRTPKQIVRDIESATLLRLGTTIEHKQVSVVQLGEADKLLFSSSSRLKLHKINCSTSCGEIAITVTVSMGEKMFAASVLGPNTKQYRLRLVAEATLNAVEQYLGIKGIFIATDVQKSGIAGEEIIIAIISLCLERGEEILPGAALNKSDVMEATARATLDAINRRLIAMNRT